MSTRHVVPSVGTHLADEPSGQTHRAPLLLNSAQAAQVIGCSRTTFYTAGFADQIPCIIVGKSRRWHIADIEEFTNAQRCTHHLGGQGGTTR